MCTLYFNDFFLIELDHSGDEHFESETADTNNQVSDEEVNADNPDIQAVGFNKEFYLLFYYCC